QAEDSIRDDLATGVQTCALPICLELPLGGNLALDPGRGVLGEFGGVFQIELPLNLLAIIFNGLNAQVQLIGDLPRLLPLTDQLRSEERRVGKEFRYVERLDK